MTPPRHAFGAPPQGGAATGPAEPDPRRPLGLGPSERRPHRGQRGTAITYGTYDLFHVGHVRLFQRIKARCDFLVVAVSTDEFNAIKGKKSVMPFADRMELVRSCRYVDLAIAENGWEQKESDIAAYGVDAFYMGDDWTGRFDHLKTLCDVHYLPRTDGVSSTLLKQDVVASRATR